MRSPRSWNDRELLRDEPFRTQFAVRALSTKRAEVMDWREPVADYLRRTEGGAAKTWIDMIFQYDSSLQKPDVGIGQGGLEIFVQVFWFIHQANEDQALRYVNQERRKRGYKYCFNPQAYCNLLQNWTMRESVAREGEDIRTNSPIEDICGTDTGEVDDMLEGFQAEKENGTNESFPAPSPDRTKKRNAGSFVVRESQLGTRAISAGRPSMTVEQEERTIKKMKHPKSPSAQNVILPSISQQKNFDIDKNFGREGQGQRTTGSRAATSSHKFRKSGLDQIPSTRSFMGAIRYQPGVPVERPARVVTVQSESPPWWDETNRPMPQLSQSRKVFGSERKQKFCSEPRVDGLPLSPAVTGTALGDRIMQNDPEARLTHVAIVQGEPGVVTSDFIKPFLHIDRTAPQLLPEFRGVLDRAETTHKYLGTPAAAEEWERSHDFSVDDDEMHEPDISDTECIDSNTEHQSINQTAQGQQFRPPLPQTPPIWAQSRQELCESFDWFRSYQGGVYFTNNVAKGYLLSAFASSRDIFHHDGKLIISHGGGKAESLHTRHRQTETRLATDQLAQDKSVRALLSNYHNRRPLVLLVDDRYALFKYDLVAAAVGYTVLGFFLITHAWAEYQPAQNDYGQVIRYKFAFQWCEDQGDPWWITMGKPNTGGGAVPASPMHSSSMSTPPTRCVPVKLKNLTASELRPSKPANIYIRCSQCLEKSPHVYRQSGWMCLDPACPAFWKQNDGKAPQPQLDYTDDFLQLLPIPRLPTDCKDLRPSLPINRSSDSITTRYAFSKGWHCKECGRLSSRFKWQHWECSHCKAMFDIPGRLREPREFWGQLKKYEMMDYCLAAKSGINPTPIKVVPSDNGTIRCQSFMLPLGRGQIHHIRCDLRANRDADGIFKAYQEQAADGSLAFRRWPLRSHKCRGSLLTNYFSQNVGEPYQYVGGTSNTVPFDQAPSAVVKARELIQNRVFESLGKKVLFNEVLSAAYMERQKMGFHSDNEKGLGPLVAGLSLGSAAFMHFRLHTQFLADDMPRKVDITFILRHGDVLVMDGEGVQRCYEHTVVPVNFRIAATARYITSS